MALIRIRSIHKGVSSPWAYTQDESNQLNEKNAAVFRTIEPQSFERNLRTNQYGLFRYSEDQYGELVKALASSIQPLRTPTRIRLKDGGWIYTQIVEANGACPKIRLRPKNHSTNGDWIYLQEKEV